MLAEINFLRIQRNRTNNLLRSNAFPNIINEAVLYLHKELNVFVSTYGLEI